MSRRSNQLSYEAAPPPFLVALRAQTSSSSAGTGPDPLAPARRRVGKKRSASQEAEDAPLVVDDRGNALDVAVDGDGNAVNNGPEVSVDRDAAPITADKPEAAPTQDVESKSAIGARRRKAARAVGDAAVSDEPVASSEDAPPPPSKSKKKAKKIKLSFDPE